MSSKHILYEGADGAVVIISPWAGAMRPAVIEHHEPVVDENGVVTAEAYDETVTPAETESEFLARIVADQVPSGARHFVIDADDLPAPPPEHWVVDWAAHTVTNNDALALVEAKAARIAQAFAELERRFAVYVITVNVGGTDRPYGCDPATRENLSAIINAISVAPNVVPNPRGFTPKGGVAPVPTSHTEFVSIYLTGLAAGDAHYAAYFTHKAAIQALTTPAAVAAYDITTGWPS